MTLRLSIIRRPLRALAAAAALAALHAQDAGPLDPGMVDPNAAVLAAAQAEATHGTDGTDGTNDQSPVTNHQSPVTPPPAPSQNVTINLINRLVQKGILSQDDATELIHQAEIDAEAARLQAATTQMALSQAAAAQAAVAEGPPPPAAGSVSVTYVPSIVRNQIRDEIKEDVLAQAREERWADPRLVPEWVSNFRPFADIRVRYEVDYFPSGNDASGVFPNFNAINTGSPFDVSGDVFSPQINVDQDRNRIRLRARFGASLDLGENFSSGLRLATGDSNSPVSANQSLGLPDQGQGGNFSKYAIWLDRAFIKYQTDIGKGALSLVTGRFDNPFFTISQIIWDDDLGFDGAAVHAKYEILDGFTPYLVGGVFPVFNTAFNFSSNQPAKFPSYNKWLYAIQGGFDWEITKDIRLKTGAAYYYFQNIEGRLSDPFAPLNSSDAGNTDESRPAFAQKGNTYMALRNIIPTEANDFGTINQFQYFGLATKYQDIAFNGRLEFTHFEPVVIALSGEYVQNLAFDSSAINAVAVNNRGGVEDTDLTDALGEFVGGDIAWIAQVQVGTAALAKRWDWNVAFGYRWVESDAVVDGFNDSDFGGGGTNLKGYTLSGSLALSHNVWFTIRYLSADSIAGPAYREDIIQFDLNAKF